MVFHSRWKPSWPLLRMVHFEMQNLLAPPKNSLSFWDTISPCPSRTKWSCCPVFVEIAFMNHAMGCAKEFWSPVMPCLLLSVTCKTVVHLGLVQKRLFYVGCLAKQRLFCVRFCKRQTILCKARTIFCAARLTDWSVQWSVESFAPMFVSQQCWLQPHFKPAFHHFPTTWPSFQSWPMPARSKALRKPPWSTKLMCHGVHGMRRRRVHNIVCCCLVRSWWRPHGCLQLEHPVWRNSHCQSHSASLPYGLLYRFTIQLLWGELWCDGDLSIARGWDQLLQLIMAFVTPVNERREVSTSTLLLFVKTAIICGLRWWRTCVWCHEM